MRTVNDKTLPRGQDPTENIWEVIYTQRAIRYWKDKKVPRSLLEQVIEAGSKAPSGSNLQPWIFASTLPEQRSFRSLGR